MITLFTLAHLFGTLLLAATFLIIGVLILDSFLSHLDERDDY